MFPLSMLPSMLSVGQKLFTGIRQGIFGNQVNVPDVKYTISPYAQNILATAKQLNNSRMPGATNAEQNIQTNFANVSGGIGRNATSSAQALAMLTGAQANTDQALANLGQQEAGFKLSAIQNLNLANNAMTAEHDKVYQDAVRRQNNAMQEQSALRQSGMINLSNSFSEGQKLADIFKALKKLSPNGNNSDSTWDDQFASVHQ